MHVSSNETRSIEKRPILAEKKELRVALVFFASIFLKVRVLSFVDVIDWRDNIMCSV